MMSQSITVVFDGRVLRPEKPLELKPNTRYVISIQESVGQAEADAWDVLEEMTGTIEVPPDWSINHDR
jgi:predicted DNA-binding antitoxin AbrB/MazE fold protein